MLEHRVSTVPPGVSETALHVAAEYNNLRIAELLLEVGNLLILTELGNLNYLDTERKLIYNINSQIGMSFFNT